MKLPEQLIAAACLRPLRIRTEPVAAMMIISPDFRKVGCSRRGSPATRPMSLPSLITRVFLQGPGLALIVDDPEAPAGTWNH